MTSGSFTPDEWLELNTKAALITDAVMYAAASKAKKEGLDLPPIALGCAIAAVTMIVNSFPLAESRIEDILASGEVQRAAHVACETAMAYLKNAGHMPHLPADPPTPEPSVN